MGNECTTHNCNIFEGEKGEMVFNERPRNHATATKDIANKKTVKKESKFDLMNFIKSDSMAMIIKIQSIWRGYQTRKIINYLRSTQKNFSKYFSPEEAKETLTKSLFNPAATLGKKKSFHYKSGAIYEGEWRGGFREGYGEMVWTDGATYKGEWRFGRAHGKGVFLHIDGDQYDGEWAYDKAFGFGKYTHCNGATYEGQWKEDVQHGHGKEKWDDNAMYEGDYSYGKKHGKGTYKWSDGAVYCGNWEENNISGVGCYNWPDGRSFTGHWKNNNMNGFGVYHWPGGRRFAGFYQNDKKEGFGEYFWPDGASFQVGGMKIANMASEFTRYLENLISTVYGKKATAAYGLLRRKWSKLRVEF